MGEWFKRESARLVDLAMCAMMNGIQWRHALGPEDYRAFEEYLQQGSGLTRRDFYAYPEICGPVEPAPAWNWESPVTTPMPENNRVHVDLYPCREGWSAPTVLFLHALMSASDTGYRRWAQRFNERGWNACFLHLPYHYSRIPKGFANGELAITADLVRTGEALRQGVIELRQLMARLRHLGVREFGVWGTSYGGWIGALLASVEADFRWVALMAPVINMEHAIWRSKASYAVRRQLRKVGIDAKMVDRHAHLTSPRHADPLCGGERVLLAAGRYDQVAPASEIEAVASRWNAEVLEVPQGHFGYQMMSAVFERLQARCLL